MRRRRRPGITTRRRDADKSGEPHGRKSLRCRLRVQNKSPPKMILTPPARIRDYVARGFWGTTTIDDLFRTAAIGGRERLAIVDAPNKASFMGTPPLRLS